MDREPEGFLPPTTRTAHFDLEGWVAALAQAVVKGVERQTAAHGLSALEFALLRAFVGKGERTLSQLADALPVDRERLAHLVGRLIDRGLLRYREGATDSRAMLLALTKQGRYFAWTLHRRVQAEDSRLLEGVSAAELATLSSVVSRIVANHALLSQPSSR